MEALEMKIVRDDLAIDSTDITLHPSRNHGLIAKLKTKVRFSAENGLKVQQTKIGLLFGVGAYMNLIMRFTGGFNFDREGACHRAVFRQNWLLIEIRVRYWQSGGVFFFIKNKTGISRAHRIGL